MNDAGAAAVCYHDAAAQKSFIATLAPGASQWVEHPVASNCLDLVMDARGDVVSVGFNGTSFDASKIVNGQASTETISDSDSPEEPRATLDRHGDGVIVWHSNSMNDPKTAYNAIKNGQPGQPHSWPKKPRTRSPTPRGSRPECPQWRSSCPVYRPDCSPSPPGCRARRSRSPLAWRRHS
jgi:hypothetical protein